jgi:hypothetical protein
MIFLLICDLALSCPGRSCVSTILRFHQQDSHVDLNQTNAYVPINITETLSLLAHKKTT